MNQISSFFRPSRFLAALGVLVTVLLGVFWARHVGVTGQHEAGRVDSPPKVAREAVNPARPDASNSGVVAQRPSADGDSGAAKRATKSVAKAPPVRVLRNAPPAFAKFEEWTARYSAANPARRDQLLAEGVALAEARRESMKSVIIDDPRRALELSLPMVVRQRMPAEIVGRLEERVNARGEYRVIGSTPLPGAEPVAGQALYERYVKLAGDKVYTAHVYGSGLGRMSSKKANINGVALDGDIALDERPGRVLEAGELPDPAKPAVEACPISGRETALDKSQEQLPPVNEETPAIEIGGTVTYVCSGGHISLLNERAILAEGGTGGGGPVVGPGGPGGSALGNRTLLYARLIFPDSTAPPVTEAEAFKHIQDVSEYFTASSFGRISMIPTVAPVLMMPRPVAYYKYAPKKSASGKDIPVEDIITGDAVRALGAIGFDVSSYDHFVMVLPARDTLLGAGIGGKGTLGGGLVWINGAGDKILAHELGHNFGLWHANFWRTTQGASPIGGGSGVAYGNVFDVMGSGGTLKFHYNAWSKQDLGWVLPRNVSYVRESGLYRLTQMDQGLESPESRYSIRVAKDSDREYVVEFRQGLPGVGAEANAWVQNGVILNWQPWRGGAASGLHFDSGPLLLDMTPSSALPGGGGDRRDSPLVIGRTFSDRETGIHITPIGKAGTQPEAMDVVVNIGLFPGNAAPSLGLSARVGAAQPVTDKLTVPVGTSVDFTAVAGDLDGDSLSFAWSFNSDTYSSRNLPKMSWVFSAPGDHVVRCEVSDMRGGVTARHILVTAGTFPELRVSGRLLGPNGEPLPNVRVSNSGATEAAYRSTLTDVDGYFILAGLAADSYTLKAHPEGYATTTLPVRLRTNADGEGIEMRSADFPVVTITAPVASSVEGGAPGKFKIARTAPFGSELKINLLGPSGTTSGANDYSLNPALAAPTEKPVLNRYFAAVIPAGADSLEIDVSPRNDAFTEGPEDVVLELAPSELYSVGASSVARVRIDDVQSTKPYVSLTVLSPEASESGSQGKMRVTRTGAIEGPLEAQLRIEGTATPGFDFYQIPASVKFAPGVSSVDLDVTAIDDAAAETNETILFSIVPSVHYDSGLHHPDDSRGTVTLLDDDMAVVSVRASVSSVLESDARGGAFLVSRSGDVTKPLAVYYTLGGTALHGTDYHPLTGVVTIPAGSTAATVPIIPVADKWGEPDQTVTLFIRSDDTYRVGSVSSASFALRDGGDLPYISVATLTGSLDPGEQGVKLPDGKSAYGPGTFRISCAGGSGGALRVNYTLSGSAVAGVDFATLPGFVTVPPNGYVDVVVTPIENTVVDGPRTLTLSLAQNAAGYKLFTERSATITINDDDGPAVQVARATSAPALEAANGKFQFWVSRTSPFAKPALRVYYTLAGGAILGDDYVGDFIIGDDGRGFVDIPEDIDGVLLTGFALKDNLLEGTEEVVVRIQNDPNYGVEVREAEQLITDASVFPTSVGFAVASGAETESAGILEIPVRLSAPVDSDKPVSVRYSLSFDSAGRAMAALGIDYEFAAGTLTFNRGEVQKVIPVRLIDDSFVEGDEVVMIALSNPVGVEVAQRSYTLTIRDNDALPAPAVGFFNAASSGSESVSAPEILVIMGGAQTAPVSVNYAVTGGAATAGSDYVLGAGVITFAPGETAKRIPLAIVSDSLSESTETVEVTLSGPTGAGATLASVVRHTYSISDDDSVASVRVVASAPDAAEVGGVAGVFTVSRTGSTTTSLTVNLSVGGTASNGTDYVAVGQTAVIPAGQSSVTVTVTPYDDRLIEGSETVILSVLPGTGYANGASGSATLWIADHVNQGPVFSPIGDVNTATLSASYSIPFNVSDDETLPEDIRFQALSSNTAFVPQNLNNLRVQRSGGGFTLTVTPEAGQSGVTMITLRAIDAFNAVGTYTFAFSVGAVPPTLDQITDKVFNEEAGARMVALTGISPGTTNPTRHVTITAKSSNLLLVSEPVVFYTNPAGTGSLSFVIQPNQFGKATVEVTVSNGASTNATLTRSFTVSVNSVNDAPIFTPGADLAVDEDSGPQTVSGWAKAMSAGAINEAAQSLRFLVSNDNPELFSVAPVVTAEGTLVFTPAPDASGAANVTVRLADNGGQVNGGTDASAPHVLKITVNDINDAPTLDPLGGILLREGSSPAATVNLTGISGGPKEADTVTITASSSDPRIVANPVVQYTSPASTGRLLVVPVAGVRGSATVTVTVDDNRGAANSLLTRSFLVDVGTNYPPTFQKGPDVLVNEDAGGQVLVGWATGISAGASAESGQALTFLVSADKPELFSQQPAIATDGTLTFTPNANAFGVAAVTVQLRDNGGNVNGGGDTSAAQTFAIQINSVNDAPSFTPGGDVTVIRGATRRSVPWASQISVGAANEAAQTAAFVLTVDKPELFSEAPTIAPNGTLTFTLRATATETARVTVKLRDDGGTANGGVDSTADQSFSIVPRNIADYAGVYSGLVSPPSGQTRTASNVGSTRLTITPAGAVSGTILLSQERFAFSGVLDEFGRLRFGRTRDAEILLRRRDAAWLKLALSLELGGFNQVKGMISDNTLLVAEVLSNRGLYAAKPKPPFQAVPAELLGNYTVLLTGASQQGTPKGRGVGRLTVNTTGVASLVATLADGTALSFSGPLSKENRWPLYQTISATRGAVHGWVDFRDRPSQSDFDGLDAVWFRPIRVGDPRFAAGWPAGIALEVLGSRYTAPTKTGTVKPLPGLQAPSPTTSVRLDLSGGGLLNPLSRVFAPVWPYDQRGADYGMKVDVGTGLFTGTMRPANQPAATFRGALFQKQNLGGGFFLGRTESGAVSVAPTAP